MAWKVMNVAAVLVALSLSSSDAFSPSATFVRKSSSALHIGREDGLDLSGNAWKPDSDKMGSTDTGDFFPDDYDPDEIQFTDGMGGSQAFLPGDDDRGPQLPGMENLGADAVMMGGIEENTDIPQGMEFIASSVPDGEIETNVAASGAAVDLVIEVQPVCMTYEDYYAAFTSDSHKCFSVSPCAGRMDRRGGEITELTIKIDPRGQAGTFTGDLVINLPEDNSKICYKISAKSF